MSTFHQTCPEEEYDPIEEAAMAWLLERDEGFASGRDEAFAHWRSADPAHAAAVARLEETWQMLEGLEDAPVRSSAWHSAAELPRPRGWRMGCVALTSAAVVLLGLRLWWAEPPPSEMRHANNDTRLQRVVLADGSVMTLNAGTEVHSRFSPKERRVVLAAGEAHFNVAHEQDRPFLVTVSSVTVRAVGTAFNVRVDQGAVEVVVASGKVRLIQQESVAAPSAAALASAPLLESGDRAVVRPAAAESVVAISRLEPIQLRKALAWQQEMLEFANTPLREVVGQFNLRNKTRLRLAEPELGERRVGGVFAADNVAAFVSLFERGGDVLVERNGDSEIVLRKAR